MLPCCDTCDWLAQFHEVRRRLTVKAVEHHDAEYLENAAYAEGCGIRLSFRDKHSTRSPASAGIANRPLVFLGRHYSKSRFMNNS